jgi:hypothetical protein
MIMSEVEAIILFKKEQYTLVKLIDNEEKRLNTTLFWKTSIRNNTSRLGWKYRHILRWNAINAWKEHFDFEDDL